ncbi:uncharacterized protein MONBRDRAFT_9854 [Monosiga brevicollis MX1]|uniref:Uncharacterized protein n=1 Tax=Monosiga brevicollis TaxID=81824 RepID=A9V4F5_MONBE|nr:uncharacterized protein MONBRDRAFT_9854 [Monosiga brevicollis MX1]EDQ87606.1 predicted protein [Monosiga brevicollis MX1]|eukprot:XP_001747526.1 hypothetical protein [Monosiga brevicollis MX1]
MHSVTSPAEAKPTSPRMRAALVRPGEQHKAAIYPDRRKQCVNLIFKPIEPSRDTDKNVTPPHLITDELGGRDGTPTRRITRNEMQGTMVEPPGHSPYQVRMCADEVSRTAVPGFASTKACG